MLEVLTVVTVSTGGLWGHIPELHDEGQAIGASILAAPVSHMGCRAVHLQQNLGATACLKSGSVSHNISLPEHDQNTACAEAVLEHTISPPGQDKNMLLFWYDWRGKGKRGNTICIRSL